MKELNSTISFIFQIYSYLLFMPFVDITFYVIYNSSNQALVAASYPNLLLSILINFVLIIHDFDYSFYLKDFLAQKENKMCILFYLQDLILLTINYSDVTIDRVRIHTIFQLLRFVYFVLELPFYWKVVSKLYL